MEVSNPPIAMESGFLVDKLPGALWAKLVLLALAIGIAVFIWQSAGWWLDHRNISYAVLGLLGLCGMTRALSGLRAIEHRVALDENDILSEHSGAVGAVLLLAGAFVALLLVAIFSR